jgi:hypothetical protein
MPVDSFNDRTSAQGPVARTGSLTGSQPDGARPRATGTPAISQADGTANLGTATVTKRDAGLSTPSGGKGPSAPQSFNDGSV